MPSRVRAGLFRHVKEMKLQDGMVGQYRNRAVEAMESVKRWADAEIERGSKHGKVRILMVDGKPGPDA